MSKKVKDASARFARRTTLTERFSRGFSRVITRDSMLVLLIGAAVLMLAGVVFLAVERPPPVVGSGSNIYFVWPLGLSSQTGFETIGAFFLIAGGFGGLFMMYHSTRKLYEPKYASFLLLIGVGVFLLCFIGVNLLLRAHNVSL